MEKRVAYYAHHQGSGHIQHARDFADTVDTPLLILSSAQFDTTHYPHVTYQHLPDDVIEGFVQPTDSPFHYTPTATTIQSRFTRIAEALADFKPDVVIVDVSVEVATFVKLLGYPLVYRLMHGNRVDEAHTIAYKIADRLMAYYPETIEQFDRAQWIRSKTSYVGMRKLSTTKHDGTIDHSVTVLTSTGGDGVSFAAIKNACTQTPHWHWTIVGKLGDFHKETDILPENCTYTGLVSDPDSYLASASVIISSSGHNAVAKTVAYEKPLILIPEDRPFDEQAYFAQAIASVTDVTYLESWDNRDWANVLEKTATQSPQDTSRLLLTSSEEYGQYLKKILDSFKTLR